jgi:hypothetical protein
MDEGDDDDDEVDEVKGYSDDGDDSDYPVLTIKRTSLSTTPSRRQGGSRQNWETVYMIVRKLGNRLYDCPSGTYRRSFRW